VRQRHRERTEQAHAARIEMKDRRGDTRAGQAHKGARNTRADARRDQRDAEDTGAQGQ